MIAHTAAARAGLQALNAGIHQAAVLALRAAEEAAIKSAKGTTLFKDQTGRTRSSIRGEVNGLRGFVEARGAAHFLEWGTRPGTQMRNVPMLIGGARVFRRFVHPGIAERPFMREAREVAQRAADYGAEYYCNYAIARA